MKIKYWEQVQNVRNGDISSDGNMNKQLCTCEEDNLNVYHKGLKSWMKRNKVEIEVIDPKLSGRGWLCKGENECDPIVLYKSQLWQKSGIFVFFSYDVYMDWSVYWNTALEQYQLDAGTRAVGNLIFCVRWRHKYIMHVCLVKMPQR